MYEQLDIFAYLQGQAEEGNQKGSSTATHPLRVGDRIGRLVLGEVETGRITEVVQNGRDFFYRTDRGCFTDSDRTDFAQMEREAEEIRKRHRTIEIDGFDRFLAVEYLPEGQVRKPTHAMAGIFRGMLFWKEECTFQFLKPVRDIEKAYQKKVHDIIHRNWGSRGEREYTVLTEPIKTNRLYWSRHGFYADARYVEVNG